MKPLAGAVTLTVVLICASTAVAGGNSASGVAEISERGGHFGTAKKASSSGIPRLKPNPALEAVERWRASSEAFTLGFVASRGGKGTESFATRRVYEDEIGQAHVRLSESIGGLPVVGSEIIIHVDVETGNVVGVNGRFAIDGGLSRTARLSAGDAIRTTLGEYGLRTAIIEGATELTYIIDEDAAIRLAWTCLISYPSANGAEVERIYADALTGSAITRHPQIRRAKNRETFNCFGASDPVDPATGKPRCILVACDWNCGWSPSPGSEAEAAHNHAGTTYDYFWVRHGRDSLDGGGIVIKQLVSISDNDVGWYPAGTYDFVMYGTGSGFYYPAPAYSLDIVAHELTHGVVHHTARLPYINEQGSIDEGLADVFAVAVKAYHTGAATDWWIAEDVYSPYTLGDAMRYLDDPARQTGYSDYYPDRRRNETHENAGITGLAFYLLSVGGYHPRRPSPWVAYVGITAAENIFYRALAAYLPSNTNFRTLRKYTLWAADDLYGLSSGVYTSVNDAWAAVGNHWDQQSASLATGTSWTSPSYTTTTTDLHTGQLSGPSLANFDLYLERWNGSAWAPHVSAIGPKGTELIESFVSAGTFRWRVHATSGSGSYEFNWNRPQ